jgi:hypothetical protein
MDKCQYTKDGSYKHEWRYSHFDDSDSIGVHLQELRQERNTRLAL